MLWKLLSRRELMILDLFSVSMGKLYQALPSKPKTECQCDQPPCCCKEELLRTKVFLYDTMNRPMSHRAMPLLLNLVCVKML